MNNLPDSRIRELIAFAEERARDYNQPNATIAAFRNIVTALRQASEAEQTVWQAGIDEGRSQERQNPSTSRQPDDGDPVRLDYLPGELDRTAPARVWLQVDTCGNTNDRDRPFPDVDGVSWHYEQIGGTEIQYVRADRVAGVLADPDVQCSTSDERLARAIYQRVCAGEPMADVLADYDERPAAAQPTTEESSAVTIQPNVKAALIFALWHHQGGSSSVGQPIRKMLGLGQHERMSDDMIAIAKRYCASLNAPSGDSGEFHKQDTDERVCFYENDFYVLSNFSAFRLHHWGVRFDTSEAAYHWAKFSDSAIDVAEQIRLAPSAHEAFKIAEQNKELRRVDWDDIRLDVMRGILRAKVEQHEYVRRKLLATGTRELVEDSWRDGFWGWGPDRRGHNWLGKLWMEVRAELIAQAGGEADHA